MNIQPLLQHHIDACAQVFIQSYNQAPWNYQWTIEGAVKYLNEYLSCEGFAGFVLYQNDEIKGAIFAHARTWWTNNQLYIDEFFIAPDSQKNGFGKALMNHMEQYAAGNNIKTITLMTHKFMPAMGFYENNNFLHAQPFVLLFKNI
jgi:aminoglycoside 6'-N-acetyltransferase I